MPKARKLCNKGECLRVELETALREISAAAKAVTNAGRNVETIFWIKERARRALEK